jgi:hypothetical protein
MSSHHTHLVIALVAAAALAACGKASEKMSEKISEKVAEKMIESSMSADGTKAKVDLSSGQAKITSTDAKGNTTVMEFGNAKVTEAELGVTLYPGATAVENGATRTKAAEGTSVMAGYESKDSVEKVAGFFREQLRAKSNGKQMMDSSTNDTVVLMLSDDQSNNTVQVSVSKADAGSSIQVVSVQKAVK